jgi:hypothetical protein
VRSLAFDGIGSQLLFTDTVKNTVRIFAKNRENGVPVAVLDRFCAVAVESGCHTWRDSAQNRFD